MELDKNLLKEFVQITNDSTEKPKTTYLRGTIVKNSNGKYVQLDGSTTITPISEVVDVEEGDRVLVSIENHKATIIGNFTFPPSARKEQEALDQAGAAQESANTANTTANQAQQKAQAASDKADTAINQSSIASTSATEAKEQAAEAIQSANSATTNANEAKSLATQASTDASEAKQQAASSLASSAEAQAEVTRLQNEVTEAQSDIDGALEQLQTQANEIVGVKQTYATKVEVGNTKAELETTITEKVGELETSISQTYSTKTENVELEGKLQSQITQNAEGLSSQATKIEQLEADTTEAQKDVADALSKANAAQTSANEAQTKANAAQTVADKAKTDAASAAEKATIAQNAADAATAAANAADQAVQSAQSDLDEAKQNLANVTSRVGATEADIADAQAKVDAAQTDVNNALANAAEANLAATKAQEAADKAQTDAETAQGLANTAQLKANAAQTVADNAQAAADQAQADVAALTKRVTTAETTISQNSQNITLNANKTDEIGNKLDNLEIGGRNLLPGTKDLSGATTKLSIASDTYKGFSYTNYTTEINNGNIDILHWSNVLTPEADQYYTLSFWGKGTGKISSFFYVDAVAEGYNSAGATITSSDGFSRIQLTSEWTKYWIVWKTKSTISGIKSVIVARLHDGATGQVCIAAPKLEKGNKATDWTPAPEDIENELDANYYTKTETDAQIKVESDKISSTVTKIETTISELGSTATTEGTEITVDASNNPAKLTVYGKSEQHSSTQQDGDNIFDFQQWYKKINAGIMKPSYNNSGGFTLNTNGFSVNAPSGNDCWMSTIGLVDGVSTTWQYTATAGTDARKIVAGYYLIPIDTIGTYTLSCDISFDTSLSGTATKTELYIFAYDEDLNFLSLKNKTISNTFEANVAQRCYLERSLPETAKYIFWRVDNESYQSGTPSKMTVSNIAIKKGTDTTYTEFVPDTPSPEYPSEIKTIPSIKNFFTLGNGATTQNGVTSIFNNSNYIINGTTTDSAEAFLISLGVIKAGTYTIQSMLESGSFIVPDNYTFATYIRDNTKSLVTIANKKFINTKTFTLNEDTELFYQLYINGAGVIFNNCSVKVQLEEGLVAHDYIPYGGWAKVKVTGKNLVSPKKDTYSIGGLTITYDNDNDTFNVKGTTTSNAVSLPLTNVRPKLKKGVAYTQSVITVSGTNNVYIVPSVVNSNNQITYNYFTNNMTRTPEEDLTIYTYNTYTEGNGVEVDYTFKVQLEENTIATEYEPYQEQELLIDLNKENLLQTPYTEYNKLTDTATKDDYWKSTGIYAELEANKTYTFSFETDGVIGGVVGDDTVECFLLKDNTTAHYYNFKTSKTTIFTPTQSGKYYLRYDINKNGVTHSFWDFKIYEGNTSTSYYELCSTNDIEDELSIENGQIILNKKIGKVVLDGVNNKFTSKSGSTNNNLYITNVIQNILTPTNNNSVTGILNDYFKEYSANKLYSQDIVGISPRNSRDLTIGFGLESNVNTLDLANKWLADRLITVYYPLAEPEEIILPGDYNLSTFKGTTHVYLIDDLEPSNMVLEYYPNTAYNDTLINQDEFSNSMTNVQNSMDERLNDVNLSIQTAQSTIDQLSNMISHLITDANGGSLMTQTSSGWTFNMSTISSNLDTIKNEMVKMDSEHSDTNNALEKLTNLVNDVANKTAYITMSTDDNGDPCIELGKSDNPFRVRITNTAIDFLEGSTKIAYVNNNTFYTEKLIVKNELQIGEGPGFAWRTRSNGNMGLVWISG